MQIELSPRAEKMVNELVAQGRFSSAEEALEAGLLALLQLDAETEAFFADRDDAWWADLRAKIREADEDIAAGRFRPVDRQFFAELRAKVQEGIDAIVDGRSEPLSPELIERIKQDGRERRRATASA